MKGNFIDAGTLEIARYVPLKMIEKDIGNMTIDEFFETLAKARYIQELEENIMARAISKVFGEGGD